jgi:hypothetical protein
MSPKQEYRENPPTYVHIIFIWFSHICLDIVILMEFPLQNRDQGNNHIYISKKIKQELASKSLRELEQVIR